MHCNLMKFCEPFSHLVHQLDLSTNQSPPSLVGSDLLNHNDALPFNPEGGGEKMQLDPSENAMQKMQNKKCKKKCNFQKKIPL